MELTWSEVAGVGAIEARWAELRALDGEEHGEARGRALTRKSVV